MLSPRASNTYSSAMSAMRTQALPKFCRINGSINRPTAANRKTAIFCCCFMMFLLSGTICHPLTQQAGGSQGQHKDQHNEGKNIGIVTTQHATRERANVAGTQGFDQTQQDATQHSAAQVTNTAKHRSGEGFQTR